MYRPVQDGPVVRALVTASLLVVPSHGGKPILAGGEPLPAEEHANLVYLDPDGDGFEKSLTETTKYAFCVRTVSDRSGSAGVIMDHSYCYPMPPTSLKGVGPAGLPSTDDLDAIAAEQEIARAPDAAAGAQVDPRYVTKAYEDGTVATGIAPLPALSPAEQESETEAEPLAEPVEADAAASPFVE